MNWTIVPVHQPLYVVPVATRYTPSRANREELQDALELLDTAATRAKRVFGLIVDLESIEDAPQGYLCERSAFSDPDWEPYFTGATAEEAELGARTWVEEERRRLELLLAGGSND